MQTPIRLPELGVENEPVTVSCWLVEIGDRVEVGDRIVEVQISGITFDVPAPAAGILTATDNSFGDPVSTDDVLGWIETDQTD